MVMDPAGRPWFFDRAVMGLAGRLRFFVGIVMGLAIGLGEVDSQAIGKAVLTEADVAASFFQLSLW